MERLWKVVTGLFLTTICGLFLAACGGGNDWNDDWYDNWDNGSWGDGNGSGSSNGNVSTEGTSSSIDNTITAYAGEMAGDAANDVVGTDEDLYWEANSFTTKVYVTYNGESATVNSDSKKVLSNVSGAYVTIDMLTNSVKNVDLIVSGTSSDGQLKIYGEKKFKLTLNGLDLTCSKGPAINDQCKKRVFVHLTDGTTNRLTDASSYADEPYYIEGSDANSEDRKGCFFSEGNLLFSGTGALVVEGKKKHGIATDGYFRTRPGVTIAVTGAAKNAIHVKGDSDENIGIYIGGGLIYTLTSSTAGKGMKTDVNVEVAGGKLLLNTTGDSEYDADEKDTSSPSGIKADGNVTINGGTLVLKSSGSGGKGISVDGNLYVNGGSTTVTTTGSKFIYDSAKDLTSSPKGIKADGDITITGGEINIAATGTNEGAEGLESKATLTISGGSVYVYAYDDAINAAKAINISGGKVYAYAINNDGIDSNGTMTISGGLTIAIGTSSPESGIDVDSSTALKINGGTVIGWGGTMQSNPSSASQQRSVVYSGLSLSKGTKVAVLNSSSAPLFTFDIPRGFSGGTLFFSTPNLQSGSYTLSSGGSLSGYTDSWNGWYDGGTWSNGTQVASFSASSTVTTVGNGGMGNNGGGNNRPGNNFGWR
jgi:hypothetical protein